MRVRVRVPTLRYSCRASKFTNIDSALDSRRPTVARTTHDRDAILSATLSPVLTTYILLLPTLSSVVDSRESHAVYLLPLLGGDLFVASQRDREASPLACRLDIHDQADEHLGASSAFSTPRVPTRSLFVCLKRG